MKVMIVDDSKAVHALVTGMLEAAGLSVEHLYDGADAVVYFGRPEAQIDLVLLDWEMPNMNGIDALPELKRLRPQMPVVMMTTKNAMADIAAALGRGAADYIMKPFTEDILVGKVAEVAARGVA